MQPFPANRPITRRPWIPGFTSWAPLLGSMAYQAYKNWGSSKKGSGVRSGIGVTTQHDVRRVYRKKTMPRRKKKGWKSFINKVNAVDEKDLGTQTFLFNTSVTTSTQTDNQLLLSAALYSDKSTAGTWLNDIRTMSSKFNTGNPTAAADLTVQNTTKIIFKSAVLDITIRNMSSNDVGTLLDIPLEVDVYEMTMSRGEDDSSVVADTDLQTFLRRGSDDTLQIGGGTTAANDLSIDVRGATPWECPQALSMFRMKILKKTKYFLSSGQTFTYQMRDPKRHVMSYAKMSRGLSCNVNGLTKWILFIGKPVPGITPSSSVIPKLSFGITRKYMLKIEGFSQDRDYYVKD